jgi:hypothetical protein
MTQKKAKTQIMKLFLTDSSSAKTYLRYEYAYSNINYRKIIQ